jgi:hypothetical protein
MDQSFWILFGITSIVGVFSTSILEWTVHRFLMHRPFLGWRYAFQAHAVIHHQVFKADDTYHVQDEKDKEIIPMAWWNGPALILMCELPFFIIALITGKWAIALGGLPTFVLYYAAYEYIHWCMHLPKARRMERSWLFRRLNGHHLLHHRYMHKNFNVVFPFADLLFGTLMVRAKTRFAQARGVGVPDVQPINAEPVTA